MSKEIKQDEIVIDNSELLYERADIQPIQYPEEYKYKVTDDLGSDTYEVEKQLWSDKKRFGWSEPTHKHNVKKVCPVCGTEFIGRPNKIYCSDRCAKIQAKRNYRARQRELKNFKPHYGVNGEVYIMVKGRDGKMRISFIPSLFTDSLDKAIGHIKKHYDEDQWDSIIQQVKQVIK